MQRNFLVLSILILVSSIFAQKMINPVTSTSSITKGQVVTSLSTSSNAVLICGATDQPLGVVVTAETGGTTYYHIANSGIVTNVTYTGTVTAGDIVVTAANGTVQTQTSSLSSCYVVGIALNSGASGSSTNKILVQMHAYPGDGLPVGSGLTSANIWLGDASNAAQEVELSGDATMSNTGAVDITPTIVSRVDGITNDQGDIDFVGGSNIDILPGTPTANQITFNVTDVDNYDHWSLSADGGTLEEISTTELVDFVGGDDLLVSLTLAPNEITFDHANTGLVAVDNSGSEVIQDIGVNATGHISSVTSIDLSTIYTNIWEDESSNNYIRPITGTFGVTYPYIYDDNTTETNFGNASQFYMEVSGTNTEAGMYLYSNSGATEINKTSWQYNEARSLIKAYDVRGDEFNASISGYSGLTGTNSAAVIGVGGSAASSKYTALATRLPTYTGSGSDAIYACRMFGDFYNQDAAGDTAYYDYIGDWNVIQTVTLTTHGSGTDNSIVLINASATLATENSWTAMGASNDRWATMYLRLCRDRTVADSVTIGSAEETVGQIDVYYASFCGGKASMSITAYDEPPAGSHTYTLEYLQYSRIAIVPTVTGGDIGRPSGLTVMELKR